MKIQILFAVVALISISFLFSCKKDNDAKPSGSDLGLFVGNIQVSDDPQTKLGYIYNAKVGVKTSGNMATVAVTGDGGLDREYSGTYTSQGTAYQVTLANQIKPSQKIVGGDVVIIGAKLSMDISVANDNVTVKGSPTATQSFEITGKLRMLGSDLLKQ